MDWETVSGELAKKLDPAHVKPPAPGKYGDYIEGWRVIEEANRIFGFGGWSYTLEALERTNAIAAEDGKFHVGYLARVTLEVSGVRRGDVGHGQGHSKSEGDAYDSAIKEAVTDALKRALRTFGNPFGLALYDKTKANVGRDLPQEALDAIHGAETLESLKTVWTANREWWTYPEFLKAKDDRKAELEKDAA